MSMHPLLKRQLKRYLKEKADGELPDDLQALLDRVSDTYQQMDRERRFFEHVISMNSRELNDKNRQLRRTLMCLNTAQRIASTGSWAMDLGTGKLTASSQLHRILNLASGQDVSIGLLQRLIHPADTHLADACFTETLSHGHFDAVYRLIIDDEIRFVHEHRELEYDHHQRPLQIHATLQDVTNQKKAEQELNLYADVFHKSGEGIALLNERQQLVAANDSWLRMTGFCASDLPLNYAGILLSEDNPADLTGEISRAIRHRGFWQGELLGRRKDGSSFPQLVSVSASSLDASSPHHYIVNVIDITERKEVEKRIHHLAHHDALTGLVNRISLDERLTFAISTARRHNHMLALMFIDMDRFKIINDTLGHAAGDNLLIEVGKRLRDAVRECDIVARIGGDEFVVVFTGIQSRSAAAPLARFLIESLSFPYRFEGAPMISSPSIGISLYPNDGDNLDALLRAADTAMYFAKQSGRNQYRFFSDCPPNP
ncbi:sensor domain-containing diguanylate cyclase [Parathalassolituus penaei]|uniref:Diguanylate cyclase n=1 Tax=Parathalassolituus penaei TaxID=2997323 RepID=A0A9X3EFS4_9GAMM|nr:sensor domain-containing diguanylate cyclase [Parathalassolituus penaei]MCY0966704.1 diguanylate cyclase [Parathalassolituus penaei]